MGALGGGDPRWAQEDKLHLTVETELEADGRWIAEIPELSGVLAYGSSREEAVASVQALAQRVLAERAGDGNTEPETP